MNDIESYRWPDLHPMWTEPQCAATMWGERTGMRCVRSFDHRDGHIYESGSQPQDSRRDTEAWQR